MQVLNNRHYLKIICEILRLTATQNISQRGHRESLADENRGNFLAILDLIATRDEVVGNRLQHGPNNAKYTHHSVQNALLKIMSDMILDQIKKEITAANFFGLICDETKDLSKKEQIAVVLRYFVDGAIHEEFIGFTYAESVDATSLHKYITERLKKLGVSIKLCVGQAYDGASVMSGHSSGVQAKIKDDAKWAIYVHCYAHRLNLVVVDSCKAVNFAADFFALLQRLYVFLSGSFVHPKWLNLQMQLHPKDRAIELKALSQTRWSAQIAACSAVKTRLDVIIELLDQLSEDANRDRALEAQSLASMIDLKFVFCLNVFHTFLLEMKAVTDCLQSTQLNAGVATDLIQNCVDFLTEQRTDAQCDKYLDEAKRTAEEFGLSVDVLPRQARRRTRVPSRLQTDMIVTEPISQGRSEAQTLNEFMRGEIYFPVIDTALAELRRQFSANNVALLGAVCALMPGSDDFLNADILQPMAAHYNSNIDDFNLELRQMKRMIARKTTDNTMPDFDSEGDKLVAFAKFVSKYDEAFYELNRLIRIAVTLPVTSVEAERSFSCLKLIKTHLRTTMLNDRLSDIAVLSVHSQRANALDLDLVVDKFANRYPNCRIMLC